MATLIKVLPITAQGKAEPTNKANYELIVISGNHFIARPVIN